MLGLILLVGIAKKYSIMLVDFTNQIRARGVDRHQALLEACPIWLRPILNVGTPRSASERKDVVNETASPLRCTT